MPCAVGSQFYMETNMNLTCLAISYNETSQTIPLSTSLGVILGHSGSANPVDVWIVLVEVRAHIKLDLGLGLKLGESKQIVADIIVGSC